MKRTITTIAITLILLGTCAVALNLIFGENTIIYVKKELIPHTSLVWYKYTTYRYLQQLETAITDTTELQFALPRWSWVTINGTDWYSDLAHDLAVIVDYIILILNVLIYPLRIGGYIFRFVLALVGISYTDPNSSVKWMGDIANAFINLQIPYIEDIQ